MSIRTRIKAELERRGKTQQWLADRLKWPADKISRVIHGKQGLNEAEIRALAAAIRRSPGWLFREGDQ